MNKSVYEQAVAEGGMITSCSLRELLDC